MNEDLIKEFIEKKSLEAMKSLLSSEKDEDAVSSAVEVSEIFGASKNFSNIAKNTDESGNKLVTSFHNNLVLLIQKTWVEESDESLKAQVLYHLEEFCKLLSTNNYIKSYPLFFSIVDDVVYLMFGSQTKSEEFDEYAFRIDPEFGVFWWYVQNLPRDAKWSEEKSRIAILLGMYFLANY
ncbi:MAG: hypothetical protein SO116_02650 [Treponema sp.]|nr:hypothetical protein [Spirochaetia bacterium]MDD7014080.1 hypothetical protein [Spirochaetales bacterium]MDY4901752.1 hypothetical protein [Treponema sp.]